MKLLSKFSFLALALAIGFTSCKKDEDEDKGGNINTTNEMTIKGNNSTIAGGFQYEYGSIGNGLYNFDLVLFDDGLTYHPTNDSVSGAGNVLYFEMYSSDSTGLTIGAYSYSLNESANTFGEGAAMINYDSSTEEPDESLFASSGTVTIDKDGETYIIDVEFSDGNNNTITAHYEGTLYKD